MQFLKWVVCLQVGVLPACGPQQPRGPAGGCVPESPDMGLDVLGCCVGWCGLLLSKWMCPDIHVDVRMLRTSTGMDMLDLRLHCCTWLHAYCNLPAGSYQHL